MITFGKEEGKEFRYPIKEYSKGSSATYTADIKQSQSMQIAYMTISEVLKQYFTKDKAKVLEIGGGYGSLAAKIKEDGHEIVNVTNNIDEFNYVTGKGLNVVQTDMHNLKELDNDFDIVLISHVFEHSFAPYILMSEFNEVLKDRGIVIIIVPDQDDKWIFENYHYIVPTAKHLKNLGMKCGFRQVDCEIKEYCGMNHLIYIGSKEKDWKVCRNE